MTVEDHRNGPARPAPAVKGGRHHIQPGSRVPGFGRVGGTNDDYKVEAILARNGRRVAAADEAGTR